MTFSHYRDKDGVEVDIVVEQGPNAVAGVEVYDGETSASFGDGLYAVPVRQLWERA